MRSGALPRNGNPIFFLREPGRLPILGSIFEGGEDEKEIIGLNRLVDLDST